MASVKPLDVNVALKKLDEARISIQPRIGASTYSITKEAIQAQPGGDSNSITQNPQKKTASSRWISISPAFFTPSAIGRGGPLRGMVASTHNSSPPGSTVGSFAVSAMKNRIDWLRRSRISLSTKLISPSWRIGA